MTIPWRIRALPITFVITVIADVVPKPRIFVFIRLSNGFCAYPSISLGCAITLETTPSHAMVVDQEIASLHTVFVIIYLQEVAWISAPLLISANVFLHACIRKLRIEILLVSGGIFSFFLLSGASIGVSLFLIHSHALGRKRAKFLSPYIFTKLFRMLVLGTLSIVILVTPELISTYFYASVYGLFECIAGAVALEVPSALQLTHDC
ncbi:unnamed protein product [Heligmosomoides polygyrus]|uniref:G protein-coupled receptor n=1 Tax=Heligmosomoides polygyrus TaxID=6339 RepID=A0A183FHZ8_HELPZ|nr:unnamed protein product [Heligmosomoides polygyrus]